MNFRSTYFLLGIVVLALAALGVIVLTTGDKKTNPSTEGYLLKAFRAADIKPEKVTELEIERPGQTPEKIAFVRADKRWTMTVPGKTRIDSFAVESIVSALLNAKTEKSADISSNLGAHGLDNPPVKVTLKAGDISEVLTLGNVTIGGDKAVVYVTTTDLPDKPQAARKMDLAALFKSDPPKGATNAGQLVKGVTDFRPLKLIGDGIVGPVDQVVRSFAVRNNKDEIALVREAQGKWRFRKPADYGEASANASAQFGGPKEAPGAIDSVSQLLNTIMNIQPAGRHAIIESPGALTKYGLDVTKNDPLQIDFSRDDGVKETIWVAGPIKVEGQTEPKFYAKHEADTVVYEVPGDPVKKVQAVLSHKMRLRDRTVLHLHIPLVDAIDIDIGADKVELRRVGPGWQVYDSEGKSRPAKAAAVNELLGRLNAPQLATSFPPPGVPDEKMGFTKPRAEVKIWEGGIVPDAKADPKAKPKLTAKPTVRLLIGIQDVGDVILARRIVGETKADFLLPADMFHLITRGRLDYVDATLKPYGADSVLKLSFTSGKETYELERPDDKKPAAQAAWKIVAPERLKGRAADPLKVADLVNQLTFLHPIRVASDRVTADVLNRMELDPMMPRMKVTATVKDQGEKIYYFGGDTPDKKSVYMKPGDQDVVFEVERVAFDMFSKADVLDMVVQRIDKTKIKAVKITGWQEVLGTPTTLELERKEGKWTLKSGGKFDLDPAKVDAFLNDITSPRAEAFVTYKTGPKPEQKLDVAKNALAIEMTMEKGEPVKMMISPPNKEGKVFATTSLLPGDVFTLLDRFAAVRAKPAVFKKD